MNIKSLYDKFDEAITWNGLLFFFSKISKTALTFFLYNNLSSSDFSLWANLYSIIFIILLWLSFGFNRSLPQYCLEFAKNNLEKEKFIFRVIAFKSVVSALAGIAFYFFIPKVFANFVQLGCILFILEGIKSAIKLVFYSYFWHKQFNFLETVIIAVQMSLTFILISNIHQSSQVLTYVIYSDIIATTFLVLFSAFMLRALRRDKVYLGKAQINSKKLYTEFAIHSSAMWGIMSANSLTERNFLIPTLTLTLGPSAANLFKVANDGALLFQRFVVKTIGTTGTSLFAHIATGQVNGNYKEVFEKLTRKIIFLISAILGVVVFIYFYAFDSSAISQSFFLLTFLYLAQIIFMGYERILEVKRMYKELAISYIPYVLIIAILLLGRLNAFKTLSIFLITIHGIRFISLIIRVLYAKKLFKIYFPFKLLITATTTSTLIATTTYCLFRFLTQL